MGRRPLQDTRQILIDTALELVWANSYGSVSVDDICKAAGVNKGSFYHFFPSKVDLALAAMDHSHDQFRAAYDGIFSPGTPPLQRFERMVEVVVEKQTEIFEKYGRVCGCPDGSLGCEMAGLEERIRLKFGETAEYKKNYYRNALRDMIAEGILPPETDVKIKADEIFVYVLGQLTLARIQNDLRILKRDLMPGLLGLLGVLRPTETAS